MIIPQAGWPRLHREALSHRGAKNPRVIFDTLDDVSYGFEVATLTGLSEIRIFGGTKVRLGLLHRESPAMIFASGKYITVRA